MAESEQKLKSLLMKVKEESEKIGIIKNRNTMDVTEAEDIKRWQEYTEELYKKVLHDSDNHDGVISHLEPAFWNAKSSGP